MDNKAVKKPEISNKPANILRMLFTKAPKWSTLKQLASNRIVQSSYWWLFIVPVTAKILESMDQKLNIRLSESLITFTLALPFSWAIFYFSAAWFSIATLLYSVFAPKSIKKYDNYEDWKKSGKNSESLIRTYFTLYQNDRKMYPFEIADANKNYFVKYLLKLETKLSEFSKTTIPKGFYLETQLPPENEKKTYYLVFEKLDLCGSRLKLFIALFYGLGFAFFGFVLGQNFLFVCHHIYNSQ